MANTFETVASEILKDSISTALFIDDKAREPFEENKEGFEDFTNLYKSFKKYNCLLDIRKYKNIGHKRKFNKSLSKIDLLVLDWQLVESDIYYLITLQMLASAISVKNIHFICIYTRRKNEEIEDQILYPLSFPANLIESDKINDIKDVLQELGISVEFNNFVEISYNESDFVQKLIHFGYEIFDSPTSNNLFTIRISKKDRNSIYINNTVIKIRNKVDTPDLYSDFCDSLINDHNIFFTLFGLEMRNRFRESAAFIGTEISSIDEIALFYHQKQVTSMEFLELLKNILKEQASSFLYEKNIKILDALEEYKSDRRILHKVNTFKKTDKKNKDNLAKINVFYNTLNIKRMKVDKIKFGDIFFRKDNDDIKFLLCITPHCDCLHPKENIGNMFHFIEGKKKCLSEGLGKNAEKDFFSFIYYEDYPICIKWHCRPFSIHIPESKNRIHNKIKVDIKGDNTVISYLYTLRENYCQRIANQSFGFPLRVGITFAK